MTIAVTGRIADQNGRGLPDLTVEARGDWLLTSERLTSEESDSQGRFTLQVPEILDLITWGTPTIFTLELAPLLEIPEPIRLVITTRASAVRAAPPSMDRSPSL